MNRPISNENQIQMYLHCGKCMEEYRQMEIPNLSPADYSNLSVGYTDQGIQIWCDRHDCNVLHMDLEGHKHPANTSA